MSRKKLLLIGFIIIILIAIPVTIFLVKQQQDNRSQAEQATTLSLLPASTATTPLAKNKDDVVNLEVWVDPGTNQNLVSNIHLEILYDPTKLASGGATPQEVLFKHEASVLSVSDGPVFTPGKLLVTLFVGLDPTKVIQTRTKIGTLTFKAIDGTGSTPTEISFGPTTEVLSSDTNGEGSENVLAGTDNAFIAIAGEVTNITTPTPTVTQAAVSSITPSTTPTTGPTSTISATVTPTGEAGTPNTAPVCSALSVDRSTTGTAPFAITFTASGTDSDGTISKVTFSYGDGLVENVTQGGGIATSSVNASAAHTYQNAGSYTASVILTDNSGGVSSGNCTQAITVEAAGSTSSGGTTSDPTPTTDTASLIATGPGDVILGLGAVVGFLTFIGAALFFVL